jgi:hypothetical protein
MKVVFFIDVTDHFCPSVSVGDPFVIKLSPQLPFPFFPFLPVLWNKADQVIAKK